MPSYAYNDGDGLAVIDKTLPNGAVEPVSNLDDALKQVKAWMKDATVGGAYIVATLATLGTTTVPALATRMTTAEAAIIALQADAATFTTELATLQSEVDSLTVIAGGAPATFIITMAGSQAVTSAAGATLINFDTKSVDAQNGFNTTTHAFVAPMSGLYDIEVSLDISTTASAAPTAIQHTIGIYVNGTLAKETIHCAAADTTRRVIIGRGKFQLAATNSITFKYTVTTGTGTMTTTIAVTPTGTVLAGARLST